MGTKKTVRLSDEETEQWADTTVTGEEFREFSRKVMVRGEPKGTTVEVLDAWGTVLETIRL